MPTPDTTESVKIDKAVLATYRFITERTGVTLTQLISDTLRSCAKMYLVGANAGIEGVAQKMGPPKP